MSKKKTIQSFQRAASFIPSTFNEADNTIELIAATEAEVLSYSWDYGKVREVLAMDKSSVRLQRLQNKAQLLDNHSTYGSVRRDVLGVVEEARIENKQLVVKVRFSGREDLKDFIADVKNGIYQNVSIQYRIYKAEVTEEDGKLPLLRAVDWEPFEVSFVSVPADHTAGIRSDKNQPTNECELTITRKNSNNMKRSSEILKLVRAAGLSIDFAQTLIDDESIDIDQARSMIDAEKAKGTGGQKQQPPAPAATTDEQLRSAVATALGAEKTRRTEIIEAVRAAKMEDAYALELINDESMTADKARKAIIEKMSSTETQQQETRNQNPGIQVKADETDKYRKAAIDGVSLRSGEVKEKDLKPEQVSAAREFRSLTLMAMATEALMRMGVNVRGLDPREIAKRAITSSGSDFPVILQGVIHKILLNNYEAVADTWRRFCMVGSVSDFRDHKRLRMGSFGSLDSVGENGELKNKSIPDAEYEKLSAGTKGNIINVSREMIINDDLNAFSRLTAMLGRAAARSIEVDVYALLAANPTMADGVALFHATHGNLVTGAAPTVDVIDGMRVAMAKQKDPSNNDYLDIRPSVVLAGIHQGGALRVINDAQFDTSVSNKFQVPNKVRGLFKDVVDTARITGNEYYAFADPTEEPVIEVAFLNGVQTPYLEQEEAFTQLGMSWRVYEDYGVGAIGWRGAVKNPGA